MSEPPRLDGDCPAPDDERGGVEHVGGVARGSDLRMDKTHWVIWKEGRVVDCSDWRVGRDDPD